MCKKAKAFSSHQRELNTRQKESQPEGWLSLLGGLVTARALAAPRVGTLDTLYEYLQLAKLCECHHVGVVVVNPAVPAFLRHVLESITHRQFVNGSQRPVPVEVVGIGDYCLGCLCCRSQRVCCHKDILTFAYD